MAFLQHLGSTLKTVLHIGVEAAAVAEPTVRLAFPEVIPLYQSTLSLAAGPEALAPQQPHSNGDWAVETVTASGHAASSGTGLGANEQYQLANGGYPEVGFRCCQYDQPDSRAGSSDPAA
jgi:hypothetical protein